MSWQTCQRFLLFLSPWQQKAAESFHWEIISFLFFFSPFLIFYYERSNIQSLSSDWKLERRYLLGRGKVFHFIIFLCVQTFSMLWCLFACFPFLNSFKDKLKDFLEKKEKGELLIQKAGNLLQSILKKVCETGWNKLTQFACFGIETSNFSWHGDLQ